MSTKTSIDTLESLREVQPQRRSLKRQRTRSAATTMTMTTTAFLALSAWNASPVFSFGSLASSTRKGMVTPTSVRFTVDEYHASHSTLTADGLLSNTPSLFRSPQHLHKLEEDYSSGGTASVSVSSVYGEDETRDEDHEPRRRLPAWLREDKGRRVQENIEKLRSAMLSSSSFFTESEAMKVTYAIREAAQNDAHKMAGAAEFCLIMVETMEMGLDALVAAAFHFCECIDARERSVRWPRRDCGHPNTNQSVDSLSHWEFRLPPIQIDSFGDHAAKIERDAARLKRLEVVASMVVHSTSHTNNKGGGSVAKKAADNLRSLYTTEAKDWRALAIRGAACLYRLRGILSERQATERELGRKVPLSRDANRVCREAFRIYAPLASRMGMHRLKNELEHAAFQLLYRRQHRTYESLLQQTRSSHSARSASRLGGSLFFFPQNPSEPNIGESMKQVLAHVQASMTKVLEGDAVFMASVEDFRVTARVKESYSTWKKMLRDGFDHITQVPDALALRIVLDAKKAHPSESDAVTRARERALCYYAQELCKTVWRPCEKDPRFKDYVANPKENGYQSLHYTAETRWNDEDWRMELQIRTGEMHKVAEFGVASHWNYKAQAKPGQRNKEAASSNQDGSDAKSATYGTVLVEESSNDSSSQHLFGKVTIANNDRSSDAYLRSLQEWHWEKQNGSSPIRQTPLVLWDNEAESLERAERIRARTQRLAPYLEALANEQDDLQRKSVFVFVAPLDGGSGSLSSDDHEGSGDGLALPTEGTVVALPAGASILDAIRRCEIPIEGTGNSGTNSVIRNGIPASLNAQLQNGDVLSIPSVPSACAMP
ncbi:unnamed protein product [Pseudo-nitzschia multistriata]|uniref:RelA/SpoT domain-containing protein n=1 Tax=Pseudo-nitzschia multistriata TaxID=183589 RepID=A0A448ZER5_9STRA|nr:unnamed protein product [Pseudo-nitzschia multistriata]